MTGNRSLLLLMLVCTPAYALDELIDSAWLHTHSGTVGLYILDIQQPGAYHQRHIQGAINAPYAQWRTGRSSEPPGMLPSLTRLSRLVGDLGITAASQIIIVSSGGSASEMAAASRVFWTLKTLGHAQVGILNGGLAYYAHYYPRDLSATPRYGERMIYQAGVDHRLSADHNEIQIALQSNSQLLDARTLGEYMGVITVKPDERPGTIPGAKHLPFDWLVDGQGKIRSKKEGVTLFRAMGMNPEYDGTIHFCHTGNRAALTWFVDYAILGHRNAKLYDGSMSEWSTHHALPIETKIPFE